MCNYVMFFNVVSNGNIYVSVIVVCIYCKLLFFCCSEVIYTGPRKVTITVKETKTETGFPGDTELISSHVTTQRSAPAASSATRELDDLMATLSDLKVS